MQELLKKLGIKEVNSGATTGTEWFETNGRELVSYSPINGERIASVKRASLDDYEKIIQKAQAAFLKWRSIPAPKRGLIVREIGDTLLKYKTELGKLVTYEAGKTISEGQGEVQEMIDVADFAVGLSRQLYGLTMHSERPTHRMYEQWHPLGIVGIVTAFNFPVAVWSWNSLLAAICGDVVIWKPSSKTPLTAIAVQNIISPIVKKHDIEGVFNLIIGQGDEVGEAMTSDTRVPLVSATGSCRMGKRINEVIARRLGRALLELGGNNAIIITEDADIDMAVKAAAFGSVGTAGQRCTSTRRLIVQNSIKDKVIAKMKKGFAQISIGNPENPSILMGPLIDQKAVDNMMEAIDLAVKDGAKVHFGGKKVVVPGCENGFYVQPTIIEAEKDLPIMQEETFAPILYIVGYDKIEDALAIHNNVVQGLSSAIFTNSLSYSEKFLSVEGSDCGIANVNIATNGAEIGGAFGGEKETGGGRESGSDAWKNYMRRQTNTINWGGSLELAQGVKFDID